jgi:hypothetical protein
LLSVKPGARIGEVRAPLFFAAMVWDQITGKATITSGTDGKHMADSLHYSGNAIDLRCRDINPGMMPAYLAALKERLGPEFDIVLEEDHVHVEYDPK